MDEYIVADAILSMCFVWMFLRSDGLTVGTTDVNTVQVSMQTEGRTNEPWVRERWRSGPGNSLYSTKLRATASCRALNATSENSCDKQPEQSRCSHHGQGSQPLAKVAYARHGWRCMAKRDWSVRPCQGIE